MVILYYILLAQAQVPEFKMMKDRQILSSFWRMYSWFISKCFASVSLTIAKSAKNKDGALHHLTVFINCFLNKQITRTLKSIIFNPFLGSFHCACVQINQKILQAQYTWGNTRCQSIPANNVTFNSSRGWSINLTGGFQCAPPSSS